MVDRQVRFVMEFPDKNDREFTRTPSGRQKRDAEAAYKAWEQACRQKWRALALAVKAKLEVVEAGIATFEQEFMAHVVMPDGKTVAEHVLPKIEEAYSQGTMPKLLPALG